jgi:hypothetical protein
MKAGEIGDGKQLGGDDVAGSSNNQPSQTERSA